MELIYFVRDPDANLIRVGITGDDERRLAQHRRYGFSELLAVRPGSSDDEGRLHTILEIHRSKRADRSTYKGTDDFFDYITSLLVLNYAAPTVAQAMQIPPMDFGVWKPTRANGSLVALDYSDAGGQLTLLQGVPS